MIAMKSLVLVIALLGLVPMAAGSCASNPPRVNDVQQANQRLQGTWLLQSYRPSVALESPLLDLINTQLGQLRVTINGSQLTAQGPGLQVARTYQIQEAEDESATIIVSEPTGVSVRVWIEIRDSMMTFRPLDEPWNGEGTMKRL